MGWQFWRLASGARATKPVEVGVQIVERWILARLHDCTFLLLAELNAEIAHPDAQSIAARKRRGLNYQLAVRTGA